MLAGCWEAISLCSSVQDRAQTPDTAHFACPATRAPCFLIQTRWIYLFNSFFLVIAFLTLHSIKASPYDYIAYLNTTYNVL